MAYVLKRLGALLFKRAEQMEKYMAAAMAEEGGCTRAVSQFFEDSEIRFCFFYPNGEAASASCTELPTKKQMNKKIIVMHRLTPEVDLTKDNIQNQTVFLELTKNILETLNIYCHSVYSSTLMNPTNQLTWSELIRKDVMDKYHVFLAQLQVTSGLTKGQTLLPQPPRDSLPSGGASGGAGGAGGNLIATKDRVHVLEGAVITWTKQIRHVLKQDPDMLLKEGKHPEPSAELQFWKSKAMNLNSIHTQMGIDGLKKVLKFLEANKSTYTTPFSRLQKEVEEAREEANDNLKFLTTLTKPIKDLGSDTIEFEMLDKTFNGVMHAVLLIWRYSKFYHTPTRLAVLIREVCNSVINQAMKFICGPDVFSMIASEEAAECFDKLQKTWEICTAFKDTYVMYRDIAASQGREGWKMTNDALFTRLDAYRERVKDTLDFTRTVMQYTKLERVDIGGTKGKALTNCVQAIYEEFQRAVADFKDVSYDIMDVGQPAFETDYFKFRSAVKGMDRRLGSLLGTAFDDLDTMPLRLKLFDNFEGLTERTIIQAELEAKHKFLLKTYGDDLVRVETQFKENQDKVDQCGDDAPIYCNLPPVAGAIYWARSARNRISEPMPKLLLYNHALRETPDEFREVDAHYQRLLKMLEVYEHQRYADWEATSVEVAKEKLKMRLLRRQEKTGLLKVNFDPALTRLLREVRFFLIFDIEVPTQAREIFNKSATYRHWVAQLDHIVTMYNSVLTELLPVEEPLLEDRIQKMDAALAPGLTELKWRSEDRIPEFIENTMKVVSDVKGVVDIMKGNLRLISGILASWCKEAIFSGRRARSRSAWKSST